MTLEVCSNLNDSTIPFYIYSMLRGKSDQQLETPLLSNVYVCYLQNNCLVSRYYHLFPVSYFTYLYWLTMYLHFRKDRNIYDRILKTNSNAFFICLSHTTLPLSSVSFDLLVDVQSHQFLSLLFCVFNRSVSQHLLNTLKFYSWMYD